MKVTAYRLGVDEMKLVPGKKQRDWMDDTPDKYAYRCLPLQIANCTGWDLYPPCDFIVNWNGGEHKNDLHINYADDNMGFAHSTFGCGIITFHSGYIFKTEPGWDMLALGPINEPLSWGYPLAGIIETYWLDFTFTFNIKLFEPGWFEVSKDKPIARIMPYPHRIDVEADIKEITTDEELTKNYNTWGDERSALLEEMDEVFDTGIDSENIKIGVPKTHWEKNYYLGVDKNGDKADDHITKRMYPKFK